MTIDPSFEDAARAGSRFLSLAEIGPVPPRVATIAGLLAPGDLALLTGAAMSGKSTLAAGLAASVSRGMPFLGRDTAQGAVFYIAAERGSGMARRLRAAGAAPNAVLVAEWTPDLLRDACQIIEEIRAARDAPALIVIDTLARCIAGAEENSARDMGRVVAALSLIQRAFPSAATVVIHHTGKTGTTARGSSALVAGADMELIVEEPEGGRGVLCLAASNYAAPGEALPFRIETTEIDGGEELVAVLDDRPENAATPQKDALAKGRATRAAEKEHWVELMDCTLPNPLPDDPDARKKLAEAAVIEIGRLEKGAKPNTIQKTAARLLDAVLERRSQEASRNAG